MKQRIQIIDGLRGVSILLVVLFHYTHVYPSKVGSDGAVLFQVPWGGIGVSIFFVVSGLVIMKSLDASTPLRFAISRVARLYPAYLASLTMTTAALYFWGDWYRSVGAVQYWANATMMQYYMGIQNVDGVYWSLRVEIVFYVLSSLMFFGLRNRGFWYLLLVYAAIAFIGNFARNNFEISAAVLVLPKVLIFEFIHYFVIGIVCYKVFFDHGKEDHPIWLRRILFALVAVSFLDLLINKPSYKSGTIVLVAAVLAVASKHPGGLISLAMNNKLIQYLGKISYSLYLLHQVIGYLLLHNLQQAGMNLTLAIVLTSCVLIVLTGFVHHTVEIRLSNRLSGWLSKQFVAVRIT